MANAPDNDAENYDSIEVVPTPAKENPHLGAVTIRFTRDFNSNTVRLSTDDAELLLARLAFHLNK